MTLRVREGEPQQELSGDKKRAVESMAVMFGGKIQEIFEQFAKKKLTQEEVKTKLQEIINHPVDLKAALTNIESAKNE